ncbi:MAG: methyltransferase [Candidatus Poribacteria bacterium]|nr:MAG: methyltransferase [Candidatus Poribacteria bacterium]
MRIVAGRYGGRRLRRPKGSAVRPTSDRVRESVFAILRHRIHKARVLDLYAGTGSLGLEALSRGAAFVCFVEKNPAQAQQLRENLQALGVPRESAWVVCGDAIRQIEQFAQQGTVFDLIFLDPPYQSTLAHETLQTLGITAPILTPETIVVVEHARRPTPGGSLRPAGTLSR